MMMRSLSRTVYGPRYFFRIVVWVIPTGMVVRRGDNLGFTGFCDGLEWGIIPGLRLYHKMSADRLRLPW